MKLILSIHPLFQFIVILLSFYTGYLGIQRIRGLHLGQLVKFAREQHVIAGSIALISMLGGFAGGLIISARFLEHDHSHHLHETIAFILLPLILIGIFTGFFLYLNPQKRILLPAIHAINNLVILILALLQLFTGIDIYIDQIMGK